MSQRSRNAARYHSDPDRWKKRTAEWRQANPDKVRDCSRKNHLARSYGLSIEEYEAMLRAQDGRCGICGNMPSVPKKAPKLYVDHDHVTGKVRGLLCHACNSAVGLYEKLVRTGLIAKTIAYLNGDA